MMTGRTGLRNGLAALTETAEGGSMTGEQPAKLASPLVPIQVQT